MMKRILLPTVFIITLISPFFWTSCTYLESYQAKKLLEDSLKYVEIQRIDSLMQIRNAKADSIKEVKDAIAAKELAYRTRPWKLKTFVDEFGERSKNKYIETEVVGRFSNSATSNEYLYVEVLITKSSAGIFLHQYKNTSPPEKFIGAAIIKMKNSNGSIIEISTDASWNQNGGIAIRNISFLERYDYSRFRNFLKKSVGKIKIVIYDKYSSTYSFTIDATGFTKEFNLL